MCLSHNVTNCFVIYHVSQGTEVFKNNVVQVYGDEFNLTFQVCLACMIFFNSAALIFLTHLILFHIELKYKGLTTYEFLKMKETYPKESRIVIKVNQEFRNELNQEHRDKQRILQSQELVKKKLA